MHMTSQLYISAPPRYEMIFSEIETLADAEFIGPKNIKIGQMDEKKKKKLAIVFAPGNNDNAAMATFTGCLGRARVLLES